MGDVRVTFEGVSDTIAAIQAWADRTKVATLRGTEKSGEFLQSAARSNFVGTHPYSYPHVGGDRPNIVSGQLQESIVPTPVMPEGDGRYTIYVGPTTVYGRIIELGGTIVPTTQHYLSWFSFWLGTRQYRKSVTLTPLPYMKPAHQMTVLHMNGIYSDEWTDAIYE